MLRFPNQENNTYIQKYNKLIDDVETGKLTFETKYESIKREDFSSQEDYRMARVKAGLLTVHHIIPKKVDPSLEKDKQNLIKLPLKEHTYLHYLLWKADKTYAPHLFWILNACRKLDIYNITEEEYAQLKKDCAEYRKAKHYVIEILDDSKR